MIEGARTELAPAISNYRTPGELWVYEGQRTTPVGLFIADLAGELAGEKVEACGCDRYRKSELLDALSAAKLRWSVEWRGKGVVDGSADIRAFQRSVKQRWLRPKRGRLLLTHAISEAVLKRDPIGNATLHKVRFRGRIDAASATVIAASLAERIRNRPVQPVPLIRGRETRQRERTPQRHAAPDLAGTSHTDVRARRLEVPALRPWRPAWSATTLPPSTKAAPHSTLRTCKHSAGTATCSRAPMSGSP